MKKIINVLGAAAVALTLTSCLKDKPVNSLEYGMTNYDKQKIVELAAPPNHLANFAMDFVDSAVMLDVATVNVAADQAASENVIVTVSLANTARMVADYNTANMRSVVEMPASFYTMPNGLSVTVAAGSRTAAIKAAVNAINFDPTSTYALGFTITTVDKQGYTISGNFDELLVLFTAKNKYDGIYTLTGYHNRVPYNFPYETTMHMVTVGPSSVAFYWPSAISVGHPIGVGAGNNLSWYGSSVAPAVTFDLTTNLVTNVYNTDPAGPPMAVFTGTGSRVGKWDPVTKKIVVDWNYNNNPMRAFFDDLEYEGPR